MRGSVTARLLRPPRPSHTVDQLLRLYAKRSRLANSRDGRQRLVNHQPDRVYRPRRSKTRRSCLKCGRIGVFGRSLRGQFCVNLDACYARAKRKAHRIAAREQQVIDGRRRKQAAQARA